MFNYGFELAVNFAQSVYLIGFFLAFLGGKYSRKRNIAMCSLFIALNFTVLTYFTFNNPYVVMIDMLTVVILHEVYCLTCLKGELAIKIILPFVASLINTIISYGVLYLTSFVTGLSLEELGLQSSFFRYLCVVLVNLTILVTLLLMWRTKAKVYSLKKVSNIIAFIAIPVLAGASQWYSTKLMTANQPKQVEENPTSDMMKSMNVTMPLMSVFFCFTFASGIGIYWVAQSVFTVIQQMVINSYLNKVDMDELVQKNVEKTNKKRAKKGLPPTKVGNVDDMLKKYEEKESREESARMAKIAKSKAQVEESNKYYNQDAKPGSLASKAGMVAKYNERQEKGNKK